MWKLMNARSLQKNALVVFTILNVLMYICIDIIPDIFRHKFGDCHTTNSQAKIIHNEFESRSSTHLPARPVVDELSIENLYLIENLIQNLCIAVVSRFNRAAGI